MITGADYNGEAGFTNARGQVSFGSSGVVHRGEEPSPLFDTPITFNSGLSQLTPDARLTVFGLPGSGRSR
jgi:hypothetical protein